MNQEKAPEEGNFDQIGKLTEYWISYRRPGFLAAVWFGSSPTPSPPSRPLSCLSFSLLVCRERGEGVGEEPYHTTVKKPGPL
jgi:hypothetical protein